LNTWQTIYDSTGDDDPAKLRDARKKAYKRAMTSAEDETIAHRDGWCWLIT